MDRGFTAQDEFVDRNHFRRWLRTTSEAWQAAGRRIRRLPHAHEAEIARTNVVDRDGSLRPACLHLRAGIAPRLPVVARFESELRRRDARATRFEAIVVARGDRRREGQAPDRDRSPIIEL